MRRAHKVDRNQGQIVRALRAAGVIVWDCSAYGGGFPDIVCRRHGEEAVFMEIKDGSKPPSARKLTPDEMRFHCLFDVAVVTSPAEALAAMGIRVAP